MKKWIAEFELEDGDTMPEHMDLTYGCIKLDFHCRPITECEDAISRQAVLDKIKEVCFSREKEWVDFRVSYGSHGQRDFIVKFIESLPSIHPKPKTGHWINKKPRWIPSLSMTIHDAYECSNCGQPGVHWWKHCIYCGSPMEIEEWMTGSCQKSDLSEDD